MNDKKLFSSDKYVTNLPTAWGDREKRLLPAYLSRIFEDKKVLFVGCSLDEDYTLEILKECMEKNHYISHYAIVPYLKDEKQQISINAAHQVQ